MLFARRAHLTRQRLGSLFGVDGGTHDLSFLPPEVEKLYKNACATLNKQSLDGQTLVHVATSVSSFISYHHHAAAARDQVNGEALGQAADQQDKTADGQGGQSLREIKGKERNEGNKEPATTSEVAKSDAQLQVLYEAKLYLLCLIAIAQNQFVCGSLLQLASMIQHHHREWALREERPFWYLYEKTPWYWLNYALHKERDHIPHPIAELREKVKHLRALEKNTFAFIGVGSRILSRYEAIGRTNFTERLCNLLRKDQLLFQRFLSIPERDQAHRAIERERSDAAERSRLRFQLLRTLSGLHDRHLGEEEEEDEEKEDVLYNLAQTVNLSYFDYHSPEVVGETIEALNNIPNLYALLVENVKRATEFPAQMRRTLDEYKRPSALSVNWLKYSCITAGIAVGVLSVAKKREDIANWFVDFHVLARNFIHKNILAPLQDMYETIRYEKRAFNIMDARVLEADVESLTRMVEEYVRKVDPHVDATRLEQMKTATANSDISAIMPIYENEMEAPIKNALFGDLVSLILIQVQKAKVDVAKAMLALDKLMRANELNFQLFAVTPALLLVGGVSRYLYRRLTRIDVRGRTHVEIREAMRNVERLLDLNFCSSSVSSAALRHHNGGVPTTASLATSSSGWGRSSLISSASVSIYGKPESDLRLEETGRLLVSINELVTLAFELPSVQRRWFLEDLQDLQAEELHVEQKLATIHRMYHTHPFLLPATH